jgi:PAS domain S-box-containing protein
MQATSARFLAGEFSEFIAAASRLEISYRQLQEEVSQLGLELSERNAALNTSLAENERMRLALQQIVDSMPCGVLVLNRDGEISMLNPESRRLLGQGRAHLEKGPQTTLRQLSAISGVNFEAAYKDLSSTDTVQEFCVHDGTGKRWLEVRNRKLFSRPTRTTAPDQTIFILRDITAQRRAEEEREAGRKAMALAEITTMLAHEIRNPLASLELFAELIEQDGHRRTEWISNLRAGIRSLSGTVNNVLSFHGSGSLQLSPIMLSGLIDTAIQFAQPLAKQAAISLEWHGARNQTQVMGNESALQQVVLNLLSNAIRHTPAGGAVTVSLQLGQDASTRSNCKAGVKRIVAEFCDSGCGIRRDQIKRVFEPGFSGSGDTSGLGLAVCKRIMKQHGGQITAANRKPAGARFTLEFPVFEPELAIA